MNADRLSIAEPPEWLIHLLTRETSERKAPIGVPETIPDGMKHNIIVSTLGTCRHRGLPRESAFAAVRALKFQSPVSDEDIQERVDSVYSLYPPRDGVIEPSRLSTADRSGYRWNGEETSAVTPWPAMEAEALYGLAGEIVRLIDPHSEADPVAVLMHILTAFGNFIGRAPHFFVGGSTHYTNLSVVCVGSTASRKGTAKDDAFFVIRTVASDWFDWRVQSGLSSGEGLLWAVRDQIEVQQPIREKGRVVDYQTVVVDPGVKDKRLLVVESEFGSTLRVLERDGNTLSAQMRQAWDSGDLRVLTKVKSPRATGAHISLLGHVTREELLKYLTETEQANGFANRILWVMVRRSKLLPEGGELRSLDLTAPRQALTAAADYARTVGELRRSPAAGEIWNAVYERLAGDRQGLFGAVTNRAEAQTMRLAMIYALLDRSALIDPSHLNAALAVWAYCEASARLIFGEAIGDSTADEVLKALRASPDGMTRTDLNNHFGRNKSAAQIGRALTVLSQQGRVRYEKDETTAGRPPERWFAVRSSTKETNSTKEVSSPTL